MNQNININTLKERLALLKEVDEYSNPRRFKKAVKAFIQLEVTDEVVEDLAVYFTTSIVECEETVRKIRGVLPQSILDLSDVELMQYPRPEPTKKLGEVRSKEEISEQWALWRAVDTVNNLHLRIAMLEDVLDSKTGRKVRNVFKALVIAQLRTRKDEFILNAVVGSIAIALGYKRDDGGRIAGANMVQLLSTTPLLIMRNSVNEDTGAHEWMLRLNLDVSDLRLVQDQTRSRMSKFRVPEVTVDDQVVSKRKFAYDQELTPAVVSVINALNEVPLKLNLSEDELDAYVRRKLTGSMDGKYSGEWMLRVRDEMFKEYRLIQELGGSFYREHTTDSVGRIYEHSEFFGIQQNSDIRKRIRFENELQINDNGRETMKLDIACKAGADKRSEEVALRFFRRFEPALRSSGKYYAEFKALDGEDDGFIVFQDASNSGTEMYALGSADTGLASISGLYGLLRLDAYGMLTDNMNELLNTDVFARSKLKWSFMTKLYNAGKKRLMYGNRVDVAYGEYVDSSNMELENIGNLTPLMKTAKGMDDDAVWSAFNKSMFTIAPRAIQVMKFIYSAVKGVDTLVPSWVMPDGLKAQIAMTTNVESHVNWCDNFGKHHTMIHHNTVLKSRSKLTAYSPRIIQSMDAYALREVVRRAEDEGIELVVIHDSFGSHPNHAQRVRQLYREVLADILEMDMLSKAIEAVSGIPVKLQQNGKLAREDILNSKYALWF